LWEEFIHGLAPFDFEVYSLLENVPLVFARRFVFLFDDWVVRHVVNFFGVKSNGGKQFVLWYIYLLLNGFIFPCKLLEVNRSWDLKVLLYDLSFIIKELNVHNEYRWQTSNEILNLSLDNINFFFTIQTLNHLILWMEVFFDTFLNSIVSFQLHSDTPERVRKCMLVLFLRTLIPNFHFTYELSVHH